MLMPTFITELLILLTDGQGILPIGQILRMAQCLSWGPFYVLLDQSCQASIKDVGVTH